jgi:beta-glucosidase
MAAVLLALLLYAAGAAASPVLAGATDATDLAIEAEVQRLLANMTVTEKARQLDIWKTQDILTNGKIDKLKAISHWGDLRAGVGVLHDVYPYSQMANEMMGFILSASRLKIPPLFGGEATHGLQMDDHTIFPSPISLAATWDTDLMERYGRVVGSEARACGMHVTWSPVLGLCRE